MALKVLGAILHVNIVKFDVDLVIGNMIEHSFFPKTISFMHRYE